MTTELIWVSPSDSMIREKITARSRKGIQGIVFNSSLFLSREISRQVIWSRNSSKLLKEVRLVTETGSCVSVIDIIYSQSSASVRPFSNCSYSISREITGEQCFSNLKRARESSTTPLFLSTRSLWIEQLVSSLLKSSSCSAAQNSS